MEYPLLIVALLVAVNGQTIISGPKNTAGVRGESVELVCEADKGQDIVEWRYFPATNTGIRIWTSSKGLENSRFQVRTEGNRYTLVIPPLSDDYTHLYACRLILADLDKTAEVMMLEEFGCQPWWEPPPMPPNPPVVIQDAIMTFTCSVQYTGALKPKLEWFKDDYAIQTQVTEDAATRTITGMVNVTAKAELDEAPYECRLLFDYQQGGSYPPEYTNQCSTYYQVTHAPTNIQVYPAPEYEGHVIAIQIGNIINCTASGRPEPNIFWYDRDTLETQQGAELEITPDRAGEHTWICKAENTVMGNPRHAEYAVSYNAAGYATDSPYAPKPPASASVQPWVIAVAVIVPILFITLVLVLGFCFVKKRRAKAKGPKAEKDGIPPDATDMSTQQPLMQQQPVPKPRSQSVHSQDSGVVTPTQGQAAMYPAGSQGRIYKPRSQGQMNRHPSQDQPMYPPGAQPMYRPPSQDRLDHPGANLQMVRRGSQDHLDRNPNMYGGGGPGAGPVAHGANAHPMYRTPSQDALNPGTAMYPRSQSRERLDRNPNPNAPMYRTPSQDALNPNPDSPQPAPRTKLSKSKENLAIQEPQPRPRGSRGGSLDQPLSGYGVMGDNGAAMKKSRENLAPDGRPRTLPKPKSRENLGPGSSREDLSRSLDEGQRSRPPTLPKPSMQQKLGIQVLPPPPQRHQSVDTEV